MCQSCQLLMLWVLQAIERKGLIQVAQGKLHFSKAFDLPTHANNPTSDPIETNSKIYKLSFVFCRDLHLSGEQMRVFFHAILRGVGDFCF